MPSFGFRRTRSTRYNPLGGRRRGRKYGSKYAGTAGAITTITDTEFLADLSGFQNFRLIVNQQINPINTILFPWLSQIAQHFAEFRFKRLELIYTPTSGMAIGGNNNLGSICGAVSYNALTVDPTSKAQLLSYDGAVTSSPAQPLVLRVNCSKGATVLPWLYTSNYGAMKETPTSAKQAYDNRFSTHGTVYMSSSGVNEFMAGEPPVLTQTSIGELRVRYTVQLAKPLLPVLNNIGTFLIALFTLLSFRQSRQFCRRSGCSAA